MISDIILYVSLKGPNHNNEIYSQQVEPLSYRIFHPINFLWCQTLKVVTFTHSSNFTYAMISDFLKLRFIHWKRVSAPR